MVFALFWICSFLLNLHAYLYKGLYYSAPGVIRTFFAIHLIFIHKHANDFPGSALSKHHMKTSDYCSGSYCSNDSSTALMLSFCLGENWEQQKVAPLKFFFPVEWFHLRWEKYLKSMKGWLPAGVWAGGGDEDLVAISRWDWNRCSRHVGQGPCANISPGGMQPWASVFWGGLWTCSCKGLICLDTPCSYLKSNGAILFLGTITSGEVSV